MPTQVYMAALAVGLSLPLMAWAITSHRGDASVIRRNLAQGVVRPVTSVVRRRRFKGRLMPQHYVSDLELRIDRAGYSRKWPVERYLAAKAVGVLVAVASGLVVGNSLGGPSAQILVPLIFAGTVWLLPDLQLNGKATELEKAIDLQLPDVLDQLTISIEAGLGFDGAMTRLVEGGTGPIVDQFSRVLQDVRLGMSRDDALRALAERTNSADLRTFSNAMAQAGRHGLPMATVLRAQASEAREKRKFRAEEAAHKVPVKILMPLVLCVLPALFVVLVGPAIIRYQEGFGG